MKLYLTLLNNIQIQASYQLMATCDSIKKDASVVAKFSDDVKALRKSVETLETLYNSSSKKLLT